LAASSAFINITSTSRKSAMRSMRGRATSRRLCRVRQEPRATSSHYLPANGYAQASDKYFWTHCRFVNDLSTILPSSRADSARSEMSSQVPQTRGEVAFLHARPPMAAHDSLVTKPTVARELNVCSRTLSRWMADPSINFPSPISLRNRLYFSRADLEHWKAERLHNLCRAR
jgi:hypothetical protein